MGVTETGYMWRCLETLKGVRAVRHAVPAGLLADPDVHQVPALCYTNGHFSKVLWVPPAKAAGKPAKYCSPCREALVKFHRLSYDDLQEVMAQQIFILPNYPRRGRGRPRKK